MKRLPALLLLLPLIAVMAAPAGAARIELHGAAPGARFGTALCLAGDLDGDTHPDLAISSPGLDGGRVTIFFGGPEFPHGRTLELQADFPRAQFGRSVAGDRDYDGDGRPDLLVGAVGSGGALLFRVDSAGASRLGRLSLDTPEFGSQVAMADVDGDGRAELLVSAPGDDGSTGAVFVFDASHAGAQPRAVLRGEGAGHAFGSALANAGDVFGRGADGILVGAFGYDLPEFQTGRAYLYAPVDSLSQLDEPVLIHRGEAGGDRFGSALAPLGDIDGDGFDDYAISAPTHDAGGWDAGRSYVYRGSASPSRTAVLLLDGPTDDHQLSRSMTWFRNLRTAGDAGLVLGAPLAGNRNPRRGHITVYDEAGRVLREIRGSRTGERLGEAVLAGADFDGDGWSELVYSAPGANAETGTVWIEFGGGGVAGQSRSLGHLKSRF